MDDSKLLEQYDSLASPLGSYSGCTKEIQSTPFMENRGQVLLVVLRTKSEHVQMPDSMSTYMESEYVLISN